MASLSHFKMSQSKWDSTKMGNSISALFLLLQKWTQDYDVTLQCSHYLMYASLHKRFCHLNMWSCDWLIHSLTLYMPRVQLSSVGTSKFLPRFSHTLCSCHSCVKYISTWWVGAGIGLTYSLTYMVMVLTQLSTADMRKLLSTLYVHQDSRVMYICTWWERQELDCVRVTSWP